MLRGDRRLRADQRPPLDYTLSDDGPHRRPPLVHLRPRGVQARLSRLAPDDRDRADPQRDPRRQHRDLGRRAREALDRDPGVQRGGLDRHHRDRAHGHAGRRADRPRDHVVDDASTDGTAAAVARLAEADAADPLPALAVPQRLRLRGPGRPGRLHRRRGRDRDGRRAPTTRAT